MVNSSFWSSGYLQLMSANVNVPKWNVRSDFLNVAWYDPQTPHFGAHRVTPGLVVDICLLSVLPWYKNQLLSVTLNHLVLTLVPLLLPSAHVRHVCSCFFHGCQLGADSSAVLAQTKADAFDSGLIISPDLLMSAHFSSSNPSTYTFVTILVRVDIDRFKST